MPKIVWLLLLVIPPWIASEFDAPKWVLFLAVAPFFLFAMTLGDPDEHLLGDVSGAFGKSILAGVVAGGLVLAGVLFALWQVVFRT